MLLFQKRFHAGLVNGDVRLTFRRWDKPRVRPGGRYRCHPIGVLEVESIELVRVSDITPQDAQRSGFSSKQELLEYLASGPKGAVTEQTQIYRVALHHGGDGDRIETALDGELTPEDIAGIERRLARMDAKQAWTANTLALIAKHPRMAASKLAEKLGRETLPFKADVRKLKRLGLTQSFEVGYEISPRGRAYLATRRRRRTKSLSQ
jgi:hypothetical protein